MPLSPRESVILKFFLWLLAGSFFGGSVRAATIDYSTDAVLARTTITVQADSLSLAEALTLVENQTTLRFFVLDVDRLPLNARVMLRDKGAMSLARLLMEFSAQVAINFRRRDNLIDVRGKDSNDTVVTAPVSDRGFSDGTAFVEAETPLDAETPPSAEIPLLVGSFFGGSVRGATIDYSADAVLAGTTVSVQTDSLSLSEALTLVENQTTLRFFVFDAQRLPLRARVKVKDMGEFSLAGLLMEFSAQAAVTFRRRDNLIDVRGKDSDDAIFASPVASERAPNESVHAESTWPAETPEQKPAGAENARPGSLTANVPAAPAAVEEAPARTRLPATDAALETADASDDVLLLDALEVTGVVTKGSSGDLRSFRANADVAVDYLSAAQLAKFAAGDLAEAVLRMPGISVADGQFAVVRGLSDRFLSTTLNGLKLPSPDPEKQAFQLDLIPTSAVEAVVVSKSFEPSLWAESAAGAMDILTRTIPGERYTSIGVGLKVNDNLFDGRLDYAIRDNDYDERFGFGSKARLPVGEIDPTWQYVPTHSSRVPLGTSFSLEHANVIPIGEVQQLGLLISLANSSKHKAETGTYEEREAQPAVPGTEGRPSDFETDNPLPQSVLSISNYSAAASEFTSTASLQLGYKLSANHAFELSTLWVQTGNDESHVDEMATTTDSNGVTTFVGPPNPNFPDLVLLRANEYFRERNLTVFQLSGEHKFLGLGDPDLTWSLQRGTASQLDHPFSEATFATPLDNLHKTYEVIGGNSAPSNPLILIWAENEEVQTAGRLDSKWAFDFWHFKMVKIAVGAAWEQSDRDRAGTALDYQKPETGSNITGRTPNEAVSTGAQTVAGTRLGTFTYLSSAAASREIKGGYIQMSLPLVSNITLSGGGRLEDFSFSSSGSDSWAGTFTTHYLYATKETDPEAGGYGEFLGTNGDDTPPYTSRKWYPIVALKWDVLKSVSLRLAYSKTDGRPSFREVGPYFNKSVASGNLVVGNPALKPSEATNYDARLEWRPDKDNSISVSYFRKTILNPIEKFTLDTRPTISLQTEVFINNPGEAELSGFEAEVRHGLGTWVDFLANFSVGANYTRIDAEVPEHPVARQAASVHFSDPAKVSLTRRLYDQPEYIANLDLTWEKPEMGTRVTLAAYAVSDTLASSKLYAFNFDLYERGYAAWDLIYSQTLPKGLSLKFTVKNLTDPTRGTVHDRDKTAETVPVREYRAGREYSVSLETTF